MNILSTHVDLLFSSSCHYFCVLMHGFSFAGTMSNLADDGYEKRGKTIHSPSMVPGMSSNIVVRELMEIINLVEEGISLNKNTIVEDEFFAKKTNIVKVADVITEKMDPSPTKVAKVNVVIPRPKDVSSKVSIDGPVVKKRKRILTLMS